MAWQLRSDAFASGSSIPREYTCDGADRSPPLAWDPAPQGTRSLALIMHDPDAPRGDFTHWVLFDLSPEPTSLPAGLAAEGQLPSGARQGRNDFGKLGYGGPCPPPGAPHRYLFHLSALDVTLNLPAGATRQQVEQALRGHVLAEAELMGRYGR